jgi:hypothetical protein
MSNRSRGIEQRAKTGLESSEFVRDFQRLELWEAYVQLGLRIILSLAAIVLAVASVICILRGSHWPVPASASASSAVAGAASLYDRHPQEGRGGR